MSSIEYRNLLFESSQEINWLSESQRLLFSCEGLIAGGNETNILDALTLFKKLEEEDNLGIDRLEVLKDLMKGIGKWNLLERIKKFEIKREEFSRLLEHISRALDESGHLEQLVSICKGRISEDRESNIKDARSLLKELEKNNNLAIGRLDILKILIGADKPDLLQQVDEFETKRKQEDDVEEARRRRNAQFVAVFSSVKYAGQRLIGTVTPYCTFRNVAGGIVVVTTLTILRRSTSLDEFVTSFTKAVLPAANTLRAISDGSVCFTIQAENSPALEALWKQYQEGTLQKKLQEFLVTDEIRQLAGGEEVTLTVDIDEEEYQNAFSDLKITEIEDNKEAEDKSRLKKRRNSDSVLYCPHKDEDMKPRDGKFEKVEQWEKSAFFWKMGRFFENQPEIFRESSEKSDSGVSTKSVFSELESEEGEESTTYPKQAEGYPRESDGNGFEGEKNNTDTRSREAIRATYAENLALQLQSRGDHIQAIENHLRVLVIRRNIKDRKGEAEVCLNLGNAYYALGDCPKAMEYFEIALMITREIGDKSAEAEAYGNLGNVYYALEDFRKAREYFEMALMIKREIGDKSGEAEAYDNLGNVYCALEDVRKATEYFEIAIMIKREIGDKSGEAAAYGNLGNVYYALKDFRKAREYFEMALLIKREIGNKSGEAAAYGNLGNVYCALGDFRKAREYFEMALMIRREIGDRIGEGRAYTNLANVYISPGDRDKAIDYLERALAITKEIGDRQGEGKAYLNLANVYESFGQLTKAKVYHERALAITKEIGDRREKERS